MALKLSKLKRLVISHLSTIRPLQDQGKGAEEICQYLQKEFSLFFTAHRLRSVLQGLGRKSSSKRIGTGARKQEVLGQKRLSEKKNSLAEPNWKVINSVPGVDKKLKIVKRPELSNENAYFDLIRQLRHGGKSFRAISIHLKTEFHVDIETKKMGMMLREAGQFVPRKKARPSVNKKRPAKPISLVYHVDKIHKLKRDGLNFEAIAVRMREDYGLDVSLASLRTALRQAKRTYISQRAALIYGAPEPQEEEPEFKPYSYVWPRR